VRPRKNPLMGALVVADVVLEAGRPAMEGSGGIEKEILELCREALPQYKVPASIKFVSELAVGSTGKIVRQHA
jgi:acyl-coenzyme A synthetase/AMP-(fatty) acid ligase